MNNILYAVQYSNLIQLEGYSGPLMIFLLRRKYEIRNVQYFNVIRKWKYLARINIKSGTYF